MRTSNPTLSDKVFQSAPIAAGTEVMTLDGTVNRSIFSVLLTMAAGYWSYSQPELGSMFMIFIIAGFVIALILTFKQSLAPLLTPVYAVAEGLALGSLSLFCETIYPGIVFQAMGLTIGVLFGMLMLYKSQVIQVTDKFRMGVASATFGIFIFYMVTMLLRWFGVEVGFLHNGGLLSIGISLFVVGIAALNLVLDFDFIEKAARSGQSPKYMEWFGAFGLLVTLVWLYVELLNLLMKLQSRD